MIVVIEYTYLLVPPELRRTDKDCSLLTVWTELYGRDWPNPLGQPQPARSADKMHMVGRRDLDLHDALR